MPVYCPFCMREQKEAEADNCCHCGKNFNYTGSYLQLPVGTLLDGKYLLGADITEKQNNALKKAMELKAEKRTQTMEEFIEDLFGQEKEEKTKELPKQNRFRELLKAVKKKNGA